jgi:hypothetical protein
VDTGGDEAYEVLTWPADLHQVSRYLRTSRPITTSLTGCRDHETSTARPRERPSPIDIEEQDDVQNVWANFDIRTRSWLVDLGGLRGAPGERRLVILGVDPGGARRLRLEGRGGVATPPLGHPPVGRLSPSGSRPSTRPLRDLIARHRPAEVAVESIFRPEPALSHRHDARGVILVAARAPRGGGEEYARSRSRCR